MDAAPEAYEDGYADFLNAGGGTAGNRGGVEDTRVTTIAERLCGASASAAKAAAAATRQKKRSSVNDFPAGCVVRIAGAFWCVVVSQVFICGI